MKIIVIGAGVIGVTTAYRLHQSGHEVTVLEARETAGLETSFANGGQIGASEVMPWAGPAVPGLVLKWLGRAHASRRADPRRQQRSRNRVGAGRQCPDPAQQIGRAHV